jgi:hypothetical protein
MSSVIVWDIETVPDIKGEVPSFSNKLRSHSITSSGRRHVEA